MTTTLQQQQQTTTTTINNTFATMPTAVHQSPTTIQPQKPFRKKACPTVDAGLPEVVYATRPAGKRTAACGGGGSRKRTGCAMGRFFGGSSWWVWVVPWLLLVLGGGVEGVVWEPILDCTYPVKGVNDCSDESCWNARTCGETGIYGIRQAVDAYITSAGTTGSYGPIEDWNTSLVTDMSRVFSSKLSFNADISAWQVGKVTTMDSSTYTVFHFFFSLLPFDLH